jgi:hypothetical protein
MFGKFNIKGEPVGKVDLNRLGREEDPSEAFPDFVSTPAIITNCRSVGRVVYEDNLPKFVQRDPEVESADSGLPSLCSQQNVTSFIAAK